MTLAKKKIGGLGRGLDSLFADLPEEESSGGVSTLPLREIEPDPDQPRKNFDEEALAALAQSITENGLLQPVAVRPKKAGPGYIIIAGERRWRAAHMAGLDEVPVIVKDVTDEQAAALALIENLQREDLDPIEVAEGCRRLIDQYGLTQEQAAQRLGKSRSALTNTLRLLGLPDDVREAVRTGGISTGHAKAILGLPSAEIMSAAATQVMDKALNPLPQAVQAAQGPQAGGCLHPAGAGHRGGSGPERGHRQRGPCGLQERQGQSAHRLLLRRAAAPLRRTAGSLRPRTTRNL